MNLLSLFATHPFVALVTVVAILLALSLHEYAHAQVANWLGDRTAERMGRLTLNPLAHIDPFGFLLLLVAGFGWAKPVPYNPYNLRDQRWGPLLVAAAGPGMNFFLGAAAGLLVRLVEPSLGADNALVFFLVSFAWLNFGLMLFNLIPVPPLDGSKALFAIFAAPQYQSLRSFLETQGATLLVLLVLLDIFTNIGVFSWIGGAAERLVTLFAG